MSKNPFSSSIVQEMLNSINEEAQPLPITPSQSLTYAMDTPSFKRQRTSLENARRLAQSIRASKKNNKNRSIFPMPLPFALEEVGASALQVRDTVLAEISSPEELARKRSRQNWMKVQKALRLFKLQERFEHVLDERDREFQTPKEIKNHTALEEMRSQFKEGYIDPNNPLLIVWKFIFELGIIFYCLTFSYRLAFSIDLFKLDTIDIIEDTVDGCFLINIFLNFVTAIKQPDGTLIKNKKVIATEYLNSAFLIDIIAIIPYELFYSSIAGIKMLRIIHLNILLHYIRNLVKLLTKFIIKGFQATVVSNLLGDTITMFLLLGIAFHLVTDVWIVLGFPKDNNETTWFSHMSETSTPLEELEKGSAKIYIEGLYFVVQTILPLGNGSAVGSTAREYLYCMGILLLGTLVFAAFFEKTKSIIASFNRAEDLLNEEVEELEAWMRRLERNAAENCQVYNTPLLEKVRAILQHGIDQDWQDNFLGNPEFQKLDLESKEEVEMSCYQNVISFIAITQEFHSPKE